MVARATVRECVSRSGRNYYSIRCRSVPATTSTDLVRSVNYLCLCIDSAFDKAFSFDPTATVRANNLLDTQIQVYIHLCLFPIQIESINMGNMCRGISSRDVLTLAPVVITFTCCERSSSHSIDGTALLVRIESDRTE